MALMKKHKSSSSGEGEPPTRAGNGTNNPYLNARREWDERYGDQISGKHSWKMIAFAAIGIAAIAVCGVAYIGAQSKIVPFVVTLDHMGDPLEVAAPVAGNAVTQRIMESQISSWIWNWRSMLASPVAQKELLAKVYAMSSKQVAAELNGWYKKAWTTNAGYVVSPHITSLLPISKGTYQITWTETRYLSGKGGKQRDYKANVTVGVDQKLINTRTASMLNPLGIYIKSLTWTQTYGN
jgi:type IV secretion system protein VirB5